MGAQTHPCWDRAGAEPTPPSHGGFDRTDHTAAGQVEHRDIQAVSGPHHLQFVDQHGLNFPLRHESSGAGALQFGPLIHHVGWDVVTRKRRHCPLGFEDIGADPPFDVPGDIRVEAARIVWVRRQHHTPVLSDDHLPVIRLHVEQFQVRSERDTLAGAGERMR